MSESRIHAGEAGAENTDQLILDHGRGNDIAVSDKVRHEGILRLVVDEFRGADLLDVTLIHDDDGVGHGQRFLLIVGDIDKGDAQLVFHANQFVLHFLAQFQVKRTQRLVQKQDSWFIDNGAGDGDPLLLAAA